MEPSEHFFRHEYGRLVASLTRLFGVHNLDLVEDVVQDAFVRALEVWKFRGMPENPSAWLMATAKNHALDALRRQRTARKFAPELGHQMDSEWALAATVEEMLQPGEIRGDLLRMMFSCCHPSIAENAQIALILQILCGFSVGEVASAFVCNPDAMEKRIQRAKKTLAGSKTLFDTRTPREFAVRLPTVHRALYLLFNEGYHGASPVAAVKSELCREAIRLMALLLEHPQGGDPTTCALASLLCLHAARLPARVDRAGDLVALAHQDRTQWDRELIGKGLRLLQLSATGSELSEYHLEAGIALEHIRVERAEDTDWHAIVGLYDTLLLKRPSPIVALNRAIAIGERDGPDQGLEAIYAIGDREDLAAYPFYPAALGEFEYRRRRFREAREHFCAALALARNPMERQYLSRRVSHCEDGRHDPHKGDTDVIFGISPATANADQDGNVVPFHGEPAAGDSGEQSATPIWRHPYEQLWRETLDKLKYALENHQDQKKGSEPFDC